jgi:hypothetical protein
MTMCTVSQDKVVCQKWFSDTVRKWQPARFRLSLQKTEGVNGGLEISQIMTWAGRPGDSAGVRQLRLVTRLCGRVHAC